MRFSIALQLCVIACTVARPSHGGITEEIALIEKQPRVKRIAAYLLLADRKSLPSADRARIIARLAGHAKRLSPAYGLPSLPFDFERCEKTLQLGHELDPDNADIAEAYCQSLIDRQKLGQALPVAKALEKSHPENHEAKAFSSWCVHAKEKTRAKSILEFPIHFCVLTRRPEVAEHFSEAACRKEIEILNNRFVARDGTPLVRFAFKSLTTYAQAAKSTSPLLVIVDSQAAYDTNKVADAFNFTKDESVRDPNAINVYVVDSFSAKAKFKDATSHGKRNSNRPFLLIDCERLGANTQNAEVHEMGHGFGLEQVGVPGAKLNSSTNIMTSAAEGFGSGGKRDIGFSDSQCAVILYHAARTHSRLRLGK